MIYSEPTPPLARLLDMDNSANPDASQMKLEGKASEAPLRYRTVSRILHHCNHLFMILAGYPEVHRAIGCARTNPQ